MVIPADRSSTTVGSSPECCFGAARGATAGSYCGRVDQFLRPVLLEQRTQPEAAFDAGTIAQNRAEPSPPDLESTRISVNAVPDVATIDTPSSDFTTESAFQEDRPVLIRHFCVTIPRIPTTRRTTGGRRILLRAHGIPRRRGRDSDAVMERCCR